MDADDLYALAKLDLLEKGWTVERRANYDSDEPWVWIVKTQHYPSFQIIESKSAHSIGSAINSLFTMIEMIERQQATRDAIELKSKELWQ